MTDEQSYNTEELLDRSINALLDMYFLYMHQGDLDATEIIAALDNAKSCIDTYKQGKPSQDTITEAAR